MVQNMYETIKIEKVERSCPACEDYAEKTLNRPAKDSGHGM